MTFDVSKYYELINYKYVEFAHALNEGFNTQNNTKPMPNVTDKVAALHSMILNQQPFDKSAFTEEEYAQEKLISDEETARIEGLLSGKYTPYIPTEEDLSCLIVSREELAECFLSAESYLDSLKAFTNG